MARVRVLIGTRKGAFIATGDATRANWAVEGPHFGGWEVYHVHGSPADPDRLYASQSRAWSGQVVQRSDDGGRTWTAVGNEFAYSGTPGTHQWYDGTAHPWEFARVWHFEPSPHDPDTVFAGVEDAGLFRSTDGGQSWVELAMHPSRPDTVFMQKHWDVMRTDDAGQLWTEISGDLPSDFGFPIAVDANDPETIYVVPITSDSEHYPPEGKLRVARSRTGGHSWELLTNGLPQSNCYVNVLRDAMAVDALDPCGVYFGTTGGQVYASPDGGDSWQPIVEHLPAVLSVEVQTLP
jgi:photosystem II stability/assembly factor-like uncharacterized protein